MDGGLGGFTVVKELQKILPEEDIIYLGDGKNNPYGNRSGEDIVHLTKQCLNFLKEKRVKAVAVACNTISTMIDHYQPDYDFKIFSIVQAGSDDAVRMDLQQIGVLSTVFTAKTECYAHLIHQRKPQMNVYAQGCPMLARLIEDGDFDRSRIDAELRKTLGGLMERYPTLDSLVFGCTHFPLVQEMCIRDRSGAMAARRMLSVIRESGAMWKRLTRRVFPSENTGRFWNCMHLIPR